MIATHYILYRIPFMPHPFHHLERSVFKRQVFLVDKKWVTYDCFICDFSRTNDAVHAILIVFISHPYIFFPFNVILESRTLCTLGKFFTIELPPNPVYFLEWSRQIYGVMGLFIYCMLILYVNIVHLFMYLWDCPYIIEF